MVKEVGDKQRIHPEFLGKTIMFWDHAAPGRDSWSPNPRFIALHAGISHVLHMSASSESEAFAQIVDNFDRRVGGNAGILGIPCIEYCLHALR